jgi:hypothetical protein
MVERRGRTQCGLATDAPAKLTATTIRHARVAVLNLTLYKALGRARSGVKTRDFRRAFCFMVRVVKVSRRPEEERAKS